MKDDFRPTKAVKKVFEYKRNQEPLVPGPTLAPKPPAKKPLLLLAAPKRFHWWLKNLNRRERFLALMAAIALIGGAGFAASKIWLAETPIDTEVLVAKQEAPAPESTTVRSRMTGLEVARELNDLPTTAVMIENSPDARPQAGLAEADLVYEAIAEGGITRFLALYQESRPESIGPVRSVRPYYLHFLGPYDAAVAHAGGSAQALADIRTTNTKDLDHGANGGAFSRVSSRFAPHNLFTSRERLLEAQRNRGYTSSQYTGLTRKDKETPATTPTAKVIEFTTSGALYNSQFVYDIDSNSYRRAMAGKPHLDEKTGAQISPKVVIGLVMSHRYDGIYSVYGTVGTNTAYIFQDGTITRGTWHKEGLRNQFIFKDAEGKIIELNPGRTWMTVVADAGRVKATP